MNVSYSSRTLSDSDHDKGEKDSGMLYDCLSTMISEVPIGLCKLAKLAATTENGKDAGAMVSDRLASGQRRIREELSVLFGFRLSFSST